ncbi:MAG: DNA polymerase III subunit delta', partial [Hyphomicrobiaceae bacterium]
SISGRSFPIVSRLEKRDVARAPAVQEIEVFPEADRLDGFPHPRETGEVIGHAPAETALAAAFAAGRMHHAWLLAGREGIGKATLAYRFARHALAAPEERDPSGMSLAVAGTTIAARQVRALSHPRLLVLRRPYDPKTKRFAAFIPVDEVRRLRAFLGHTADTATWRAVVVDQADEMNVNAANALLKPLEEPPARTVFLLISSQPGRLLTTIRSRCRTLLLTPPIKDDLRQAAGRALAASDHPPVPDDQWPALMGLAQGSVRRLLSLAHGGGIELNGRIESLFAGLPGIDWRAAHTLADDLSSLPAEQRFETFFELLLGRLAALVRARALDGRDAMASIPEDRLAAWAELWETIVARKSDALALNLDRKTLILDTLSRMERLARA